MDPNRILDKSVMEDFFRQNLRLFPEAEKLISVAVHPHNPLYILDQNTALAEYKVTTQQRDGSEKKHTIRGSSDTGLKRQKHFHTLEALRKNGFDTGVNVVAKPLGYFSDLHLLLYYNVPGESLYDKFQYAEANVWREKTKAALDWLIDFHEKKPLDIPEAKFHPSEEKKKFIALVNDVCKNFPDHETAVRRATDQILKDEEKLFKPDKFHLTHGDFQPHNIIFRDIPLQTIAIDFNDAMYYEELYDLSYFITQTEAMLNALHGLRSTRFLPELIEYYLAKRGIAYDEITKHKILLFRIKTLIHIKSVTQYQIVKDIESYIEASSKNHILNNVQK